MKMTCRAYGLDVVDRLTRDWANTLITVVGAALLDEMAIVMVASKQLCPVDSGRLQQSGAVSDLKVAGTSAAVSLSYGGDNGEVPYALLQHERLDFRHAAGKEAKFLERPLLEWANGGVRAVQGRTREGLAA